VYFRKGEPSLCSNNENGCLWRQDDGNLIVRFENGKTVFIYKAKYPLGYSPPFRTVEEMHDILGKEDILSVSKDMMSRSYTYLEWGFTFNFKQNKLESAEVGRVVWRNTLGVSEYYVNSKQICPSENCPFDEEGKVKPEYEGKSYKDFL
jgi:hypothetical protein